MHFRQFLRKFRYSAIKFLKSTLKRLKLSGLLSTLEVRLQEAAVNQLSCAEFLELIVNDEIAIREDRAIPRRVIASKFRELR
jgi:hypothetical protein